MPELSTAAKPLQRTLTEPETPTLSPRITGAIKSPSLLSHALIKTSGKDQ